MKLDRQVHHPRHTRRYLVALKEEPEVDIPDISYEQIRAYARRLLAHISDHCNFVTQFSDLA